jgi:hypothetical protein
VDWVIPTVTRSVAVWKTTSPVYRSVHQDFHILGTVLGWEPDRFMY